jgi:hypothetical protein
VLREDRDGARAGGWSFQDKQGLGRYFRGRNYPGLLCFSKAMGYPGTIPRRESEDELTEDSYRELGRRLLAAVESHRLNLGSMDHTLKNRIPEEVDPSWSKLARALDGSVRDQIGKGVVPHRVRAPLDKVVA